MIFDPNSGKCGYYDGKRCRPGETVHIPNAYKDLDDVLRKEKVIHSKTKVRVPQKGIFI